MGSGSSSQMNEKIGEMIDGMLENGQSRQQICDRFKCELHEDKIEEYSMYV